MKKTPLRRSTARIRPRSKKTEAKYVLRRALVARLLSEEPWCQRCKKEPSADVHERLTRARGGSILDEANCVAICRACHTYIHDHPAEATREGWLTPRHDMM